jgi:hypothetical protein
MGMWAGENILAYRTTTGEVPVGVLASPFASITSCSMSMNSRRRGCFFASAISAPAELTRQMFGTAAFLPAATNSIVISNLSLCAGGIMHNVSAPDSFSVAAISFTFPGLCAMMVTPSFWSSLHFADMGCRVSPQTESTLPENLWLLRSNSAIKKPVCPSMAERQTLRDIVAAPSGLFWAALRCEEKW